ncbi:MAG: glycosyltransferase [Oscillospiraceae bacterium]
MKLLFVHDATLKYDDNGNYYGIEITPKTLQRYRYFTDDITMVVRTKPLSVNDILSQYTKIPSKYKIVGVPNYMSVKGIFIDKPKVKRLIGQLVSESDLIVARFSGQTGRIAARECKKHHKQYIIESIGCAWDSLWHHSIKGKLIAPWSFIEARALIKKAPYVTYVTNSFLQRRYPSKGKTIGVSDVELIDFDNKILEKRITKIKEKSNNSKIILGTLGAVNVKYKGHRDVIEAIARLKKQGITKYKYQIVGGGDQSYLKSIVQSYGLRDQVLFLGTMSHDKVFDWFDSIDIYIQPSMTEGLPRSLVEAMSRAVPCIGSDVGGIPELLHETCIFKRNNNVVNNICNSILSMNEESQIFSANKNYAEALMYKKEILEEKRFKFFQMVKEENSKW